MISALKAHLARVHILARYLFSLQMFKNYCLSFSEVSEGQQNFKQGLAKRKLCNFMDIFRDYKV
jgi:hypothetical protein